MKVADAIRFIKDNDCDSSGSRCQFFDLGDGTGVKLYEDKSHRDRSSTVQKYIFELGLAPAVGKSFKVPFDGMTFYAFFTEVVEPLPGYGYDNCGPDDIEDLQGRDEYELDALQDHVDYVLGEFKEKTGFPYLDDHTNNFGLDSKGDLKIIDFDTCYNLHSHIS